MEDTPQAETTRLIEPAVLRNLAIALALTSAFMAAQGAVGVFILAGVAALACFAASQLIAKRPLVAALGATLTGTAIGTYLAFFMEKAESFCGTSSWSNCGKVLNPHDSPWAEIYGIPTSLLACAFYAGLSLVLIQGLRTKKSAEALTLALLGGVGATGFSLFLAYQSKVVLGEWCLFCMSLYAVAFTLLTVAIVGLRGTQTVSLKEALIGSGGSLSGAGVVAGLLVLAIGPTGDAAHADHSHGPEEVPQVTQDNILEIYEESITPLFDEITAPLALSGREPSKGSIQAEWTVVEFTDYGCGHCATEAPRIQEVVKRHPRMKLLHKHYAFIGDGSRLAARAAVCAHEQGRFWEMNSALFDNMKRDWSEEDLVFLAKARAGVSPEAFESCIADEGRQASVDEDYRVGDRVGVRGTPSFYLSFDGSTWLKVQGGSDAVDILLSAAEQGAPLPGLSANTNGESE